MAHEPRVIIQQEETGYVLNPRHSSFALVVPEDSVNLVINPEIVDSVGYAAYGGAISVASDVQRRGARSLLVTPSSEQGGVSYTLPLALPADHHYTFSVDVRSVRGGAVSICFTDANDVQVGSKNEFYAPPFWVRKGITVFTGASGVRKLVVHSRDGSPFYVDGFQCENKPYATTFISGNIEAPPDLAVPGRLAYGWMGAPHRSMSFRTRFAGHGGRPIPLRELGLDVTDFAGFGHAAPEVLTSALAMRSDRVYRGAFVPERQFTIAGYIQGSSLAELLRKRSAIGYSAYGDGAEPQPVTLHIQFYSGDTPLHETVEVQCIYAGGLEGIVNNLYQEKVSIVFKSIRPFLRVEGNRGVQLSTATSEYNSIATAIYADGTADALPDGGGGYEDDDKMPLRMALGVDGLLYLVSWDKVLRITRSAATTAFEITNGRVCDIVSAPDGRLWYLYLDSDEGLWNDPACHVGHVASWDPRSGVHNYLGAVNFYSKYDAAGDPVSSPALRLTRIRVDEAENKLYVCGNFGSVTRGTGVNEGDIGYHYWESGGVVHSNEPAGIIGYDFVTGNWFGFPEIAGYPYDDLPYCVEDCAPTPMGMFVVGHFYRGEGGGTATHARYFPVDDTWRLGSMFLARASSPGPSKGTQGPYCCLYDPRYGQLYIGGSFNRIFFVDIYGVLQYQEIGHGICVLDCISGHLRRVGFGVAQRDPAAAAYVTDMALSQDGNSIYVVGQFSEAATTADSSPVPPPDSISYRPALGICTINTATDEWIQIDARMPMMWMDHAQAFLYYGDSVIAPRVVQANSAYSAVPAPAYTQWYGDMTLDAIVNNRGATYVSHSDYGAAVASPVTVVDVSKGARAVARLEVTGPCHLRKIINATSGASMDPDMYINAGETVIFSFSPGPVWLRSTTRSQVAYTNLGKDSWPDLRLVGGKNNIVLGIEPGAGCAAYLYWHEEYATAEALIR